ncbi:MAG: TonB-dependent receptor [Desulfuromonadaceae bacterium]|nr:TonB-dependent receptor [Desulfuromonadaceae bacterium]
MKQKALQNVLFSGICCLCLLQQHVYGAEPSDRAGVYTLGEVVVSGQGDGVEVTETVHTVTAEDIRSSGARTLDQAIMLLPGVNIRTGGEGIPRIDIRGFRTRHVLLLLDGIPMNSALDQQFDPTIIPTENIAEIKLTSGASSVLYGQGGLGGVINIITKKGVAGMQGMIAGETGDHAPYHGRGTLSGATDKFNYFLSGSASKVDGYPLSNGFKATSEQGAGYRTNSDSEKNTVFSSIGFTPNKDLSLGVTLSYSQGSFGKPSSAINDPFDPFANPPKYTRVDDYSGGSAQIAADYAVTGQLTLRGRAFFNRSEEQVNQYDNSRLNSFNLVAGSFQERVITSVKGIALQPRYEMGSSGVLSFSLAAEEDHWENSGVITSAANRFSPLEADKSLGIYSGAVEYELSPLPGLALVAGYGHYLQSRDDQRADDYSLLAGVAYDLAVETRLKASFKRGVRFPSLGDLYDLSKGNPRLSPERSFTYEIGMEQKLPRNSSVSLTGFYTIAENLIQNDQSTSRNTNLAEVRFAGVELSTDTRCLKNLLLRASYAHLYSEDRSRVGRDEQQYTPGDKAALEGKYDFDSGFSSYVSLRYVGNQYFYTKNNVTPMQKAKLNDYTLLNIKLSQKLVNNTVTLYLGVDNLLDENYETSYGIPRAGRFFYGGVEFRM